ncbi:MAG: ATP-binding protein [Sulfuriferula sp.]
MMPHAENDVSESFAGNCSQAGQLRNWRAFPFWAAFITGMLGLVVLIGWTFSIPLLTSVFPGAVEMKANTAVGLMLAAWALFMLVRQPSQSRQRLARILALVVVALGIATLSQYLFGWHLGIDELLFHDTADAYNAIRGRMSPFTAAAFIIIGLTLTALPVRSLRPLVRLMSIIVIAIGAIVLLSYLWNTSELVTDSWLPPVAVNSAFAFTLLGGGMFLASWVPEPMNVRNTSVEIKILAGFIFAFMLLIVGGGYIYRSSAEFVDSAKWVTHTEQVRAELGQLFSAILHVESTQRSYLLTGKQSQKEDYARSISEVGVHKQKLAQLVVDNPQQISNTTDLGLLIGHRLSNLAQNVTVFEHQGEAAYRVAIANNDGIRTMQAIHSQIKRMDNVELRLLSNREAALAHHREHTLVALMVMVAVTIGILTTLFLGIRREIIARAQAEVLLNQAKEKAENASRSKDSFLATMSHEIRTPLTGMLGMLELLSLTNLDNEQHATLDAAWDSGRGLLRIVSDILDWSKIEEGKLELSPHATSIPQLLQEVINTYSRVASAKSLLLWQHADARLSAVHWVDALRLSQVLNNFVSNAIKFTQRGEIELRADLLDQLDSGEQRIRFSVKDTGIGIAKEVQQLLFQRYRQESADTARMFGGTGLGLAICRHLTELLGGDIELQSEPGQGSIFSIALTLSVSSVPAESVGRLHADVAQRAVKPLFDSNADTPLVLTVDDHPINRDLLARQIRLLGLRAETAENGKAALSMWRGGRFAMLITDCHMPEMDGYALSQAIRKIEIEEGLPHTPIIAWTANALADEALHCHDAGMDEILVKPTDLAQLKRTLAKWLCITETGHTQPIPALQAAGNGLNAGPIDYAILSKIVPGIAEQIHLLHDFQVHIRADRAKLLKQLELGEQGNVEHILHRMKGSSRMVGAQNLSNACVTIEAASNGSMGDVLAAMTGLDEAIKQIENHYNALSISNG